MIKKRFKKPRTPPAGHKKPRAIPLGAPLPPRPAGKWPTPQYAAKLAERMPRGFKAIVARLLPRHRRKPPMVAQFFRVHGQLFARVISQRLYKYHPTKGWRGEKWA